MPSSLADYGWADSGWHRPEGYKEVQTPNMDKLVKEGIELDRNYAFKFCAPSRHPTVAALGHATVTRV